MVEIIDKLFNTNISPKGVKENKYFYNKEGFLSRGIAKEIGAQTFSENLQKEEKIPAWSFITGQQTLNKYTTEEANFELSTTAHLNKIGTPLRSVLSIALQNLEPNLSMLVCILLYPKL